MARIAFIIGERFLYWNSILLALAAAAAICVFLSLYLSTPGRGAAAAVAVPMALVLSMVLSRLVHWYCRVDSYASLWAALTNYSTGGYALMGAFAGCALTALFLRLVKLSDSMGAMLDCMSLAGAAGIALGRLASFFDGSARGMLVSSVKSLPWVYPVMNQVSGQLEYRLATFLFQSVIAAVIFAVLLVLWLRERRRGTAEDGDICLLFLLCHGAVQVALDSTRYDSLFFRSNGFVSIVQVLGALAIGLTVIVFSVRLVRRRGFKAWYLLLWLAVAALLGLGGYMEYHVQRHASEAVFAYSMMSLALAGLMGMGFWIRALAGKTPVPVRTAKYLRK